MDYNELIKHFGDQGKAAKALDVSQAAVSHWRNGIPKLRQYQIAAVIAAEPNTIAPETPIAAPQSVPAPKAVSREPMPGWDRSIIGIAAVGEMLDVDAHPGETWTAYAKRLRVEYNKR